MKVLAALLLLVVVSSAKAQDGDYHPIEDPPLTYAITEPIDEMLEQDFTPWNYAAATKKWSETKVHLDLEANQNFTFIKGMEFRRALSPDHRYGLVTIHNPIIHFDDVSDPDAAAKEDRFYIYSIAQTEQFKPFLAYLDKINAASTIDAKMSSLSSFEVRSFSSFEMELGAQVRDEINRSITEREKEASPKVEGIFRFNVIPVMSKDGGKMIRFVIDHGVVAKGQSLKKFDKNLLNKSYYEIEFDQFYAFISVMANRFENY